LLCDFEFAAVSQVFGNAGARKLWQPILVRCRRRSLGAVSSDTRPPAAWPVGDRSFEKIKQVVVLTEHGLSWGVTVGLDERFFISLPLVTQMSVKAIMECVSLALLPVQRERTTGDSQRFP
jgi:hypothetical protein